MIAILTDKPAVGKEIAKVVGATKCENGYMSAASRDFDPFGQTGLPPLATI